MKEIIKLGAIKGRHEMPVSDYIFDGPVDPTDVGSIYKQVSDYLNENVGIAVCTGQGLNQHGYTDDLVYFGLKKVELYVTGLTVVTAAVIRFAAYHGIELILMHYNAKTGKYYPQVIF